MKRLLLMIGASAIACSGLAENINVPAGETLALTANPGHANSYEVFGTLELQHEDVLNHAGASVLVRNGGVIKINKDSGDNYGCWPGFRLKSDATITVEPGGLMDVVRDGSLGLDAVGLIDLAGGTLHAYNTAPGLRGYLCNVRLSDGATITGGSIGAGWAREDYEHRNTGRANIVVDGTSPSSINTETFLIGAGRSGSYAAITGKINGSMGADFTVADVTGDGASDLVVNARVTVYSDFCDWPAEKLFMTKTGAGTMELANGIEYVPELKLGAGTLLVKGEGSALGKLTITGKATLAVGEGADLSLGALAVEGGTLTLDADLRQCTITLGAVDQALLDAIVYRGKTGVLDVEAGRLVSSLGSELPTLGPVSVVVENVTTAVFSAEILDFGDGQATADLYVAIGPSPTELGEFVKIGAGDAGATIVTGRVEGLAEGGTYYYAAKLGNAAGFFSSTQKTGGFSTAREIAHPGDTLVWIGGASGLWDLAALSWKNENNVAVAWVDGANAVFTSDAVVTVSDEGRSALSLTVTAGSLTVGGGSLAIATGTLSTGSGSISFLNDVSVAEAVTVSGSVTVKGGLVPEGGLTLVTDSELMVAEGGFLGADGVFPGRCQIDGALVYASAVPQTFGGKLTTTGEGTFETRTGTTVTLGTGNEKVAMLLSGTVFVNDYWGLAVKSIVIRDGGIVNLNHNGSWECGTNIPEDSTFRIEKGGRLVEYRRNELIGKEVKALVSVVGGTIEMHKNTGGGYCDNFPRLELSDGASVVGTSVGFGRRGENWGDRPGFEGKLMVTGTSPSSIDTTYLTLGGGDSYSYTEMIKDGKSGNDPEGWTLTVADVTGDDGSDLIVNAETRWTDRRTADWPTDSRLVTKRGAGTVEFTKKIAFDGVLALEDGEIKVSHAAPLEVTALKLKGDAALAVADGATISFGSQADVEWAAGAKLAVTGAVGKRSVRFGMDSQGLTEVQLKAMTLNGERVRLDDEGYLRPNIGLVLSIR